MATITEEASNDRCRLCSENQTGVCEPMAPNVLSETIATVAETTHEDVGRTRLGDVVARGPVTSDACIEQSSRLIIADHRTVTVRSIKRLVVNLEAARIPQRSLPDVRLNTGLAGPVSIGLRSVPGTSPSDMVLTRIQSKERTRREQRSQRERELQQKQQQQQGPSMEEGEDTLAEMPMIGGVTYSSTVASDE